MNRGKNRLLVPLVMGLCLLSSSGCVTLWSTSAENPFVAAAPTKKEELPPRTTAQICLNLAETLEKSGHARDAAGQYEKARQLDARLQAKICRRLGLLYDRLGEYPLAEAEYQKALKNTPRDAELLNNLGYCFYNQGKWKDAEEQYRKALAIQGQHKRAWVNLGLTLGQQGRVADSLDAFTHAVSKAEAYSNLGFILTTQGHTEQAKNAYRAALELEPNLRIAQAALHKLENASSAQAPSAPSRQLTTSGHADPLPPPGSGQGQLSTLTPSAEVDPE